MRLQCECGKFQAEWDSFPQDTPGRLKCYCDDCQTYLHHLNRADLLDTSGGTEVVPVYPAAVRITAGREQLRCVRLTDKGLFRFYTACCNTPVANVRAGTPWIGFHRRMLTTHEPAALDRQFGGIRGSIMGKFAKGPTLPGTPDRFSARAAMAVMPFLLLGKLFGKSTPSPFFPGEGQVPVAAPRVLSGDELRAARAAAGF